MRKELQCHTRVLQQHMHGSRCVARLSHYLHFNYRRQAHLDQTQQMELRLCSDTEHRCYLPVEPAEKPATFWIYKSCACVASAGRDGALFAQCPFARHLINLFGITWAIVALSEYVVFHYLAGPPCLHQPRNVTRDMQHVWHSHHTDINRPTKSASTSH